MHLDYGPCGVPGSTEAVPVSRGDGDLAAEVHVPRKCASCPSLEASSTKGYSCRKDRNIWGDFPRDLDWGEWNPPFILARLAGARVTRAMCRDARANQLVDFVRAYRLLNPDFSVADARAAFGVLRERLAALESVGAG